MKLNVRPLLCLAFCLPLACHKDNAKAPGSSASALSSGSSSALPAPAAPGSLAILDGFEGEIGLTAKGKVSKAKAAGDAINLTLQVKDGKFRIDLPEGVEGTQAMGKAYLLVMPTDKKLYAVMDAKKQAIQIDFDKFASQAKMLSHAQPSANTGAPAQVEKTGKTDSVAGYKCEIWQIAQAQSTSELCIAEQDIAWFHIPLSGVPAEYAWASEITDGKHFPLRFIGRENGAEESRIEVTSIQKKSLPASDFSMPTGYNVIDLDQMLGAMMGGMGLPPGAMSATPTDGPPRQTRPHHARTKL